MSRSYQEMLFVDTISLTFPIDISRREDVQSQIFNASEPFLDYLEKLDATKTGYRQFYRLEHNQKRVADIFVEPRYPSACFLRLEYSARKIGVQGKALLGAYLRFVLGDRWLDDFVSANLTRIDLSIDLFRRHISNLLIERADGKRKSHLYRSSDGEPQTFYFPVNANKQLVVYNKLQEIMDLQGEEERVGYRPTHRTRIEFRQTNLRGYTLLNFYSKQYRRNPFRKFRIRKFSINPDILMSDTEQRLCFDALRMVGLENVLTRVKNETDRENILNFYNNLPTPDFQRFNTLIWAGGLRRALQNALPT